MVLASHRVQKPPSAVMLLNPFYYYLTFTYNKEKEEPFLTYVHKGNAVFLEAMERSPSRQRLSPQVKQNR